MARTPTPTLALILAGGLATGLALARPASPVPLTTDGSAPTAATAADPAEPSRSSRGGNRYAGARGSEATTPAPTPIQGDRAASAPITIEGFAFDGPVAVAAGAPLAVTNLDGVAHTLSFRTGGTDTGTIDGGATTTVVAPDAPGTYAFICRIHPSMQGEIEITG